MRAAYAAAVRAQEAYNTEEKRLNAGSKDKSTNSAYAANVDDATHSHGNQISTPEDYHRDRIAQSEVKIANLKYELSEEKDRLDVYKQNLHECQSGEDLNRHVERDCRAEFWLEQLQTKYRHYPDYEVAMILDEAGFSSIDLCCLVVDMAKIIKVENRKNIEAIFKLVDCNGMVTTPGFDPKSAAILQQIWNRPFDTNSRTIKPVNIQDMTDRFALELSFQKTLDIIRHCATVEHIRRSTKNKTAKQNERDRLIIELWEAHPEFHSPINLEAFCKCILVIDSGETKESIRDTNIKVSSSTVKRIINAIKNR
ncbi:phage-like protein [Salmonella bongori]|nr:phage-like protein [Salmonella bongori]